MLETFDPEEVREQSLTLIRDVLEQACRNGAQSAEAAFGRTLGCSVRTRKTKLESLEYENDRELSLTVYSNSRKGSASTSDFSPQSVKQIIDAACSASRFTGSDECFGLADKTELADPDSIVDLDLDHFWKIAPNEAAEIVKECEAAALDHPQIINSEGAYLNTSRSFVAYGNTNDFFEGYAGTGHSQGCYVVGADEHGNMQRDGWFSVHRRSDGLEASLDIASKAQQRVLSRLGARKIASRKTPVIFSPETGKSLFGSFIGAIKGIALYTNTSFLSKSLGEKIFADWVEILEQPLLPLAIGSCAFDDDGVATRNEPIVRDGIVRRYVLDCYSARKMEMKTTANAGGVRNLLVRGNVMPYDEMLVKMGNGLIVTELIGHGINLTNGDYSRGAAGFWVENGEIAFPVEGITIAGNLKNMFKGMLALGDDLDTRTNIRCPSVLIDTITVAGT